MGVVTLKKAKWLWQDYTGAKWKNLKWANTGDNKASYVYPQGKNSKSSYRPKSLFYHYQYKLNTNKYETVNVKWIVAIGKYNKKSNDFPTIKVFTGDNNAPYKKAAIKKVSKTKRLPNEIELDNYVLEYDLGKLTPTQLKNLIIELDFSRTKVTSKSTISVNRARLEISYQSKFPLFSVYDSISPTDITTKDTAVWEITVKNSQKKGNGKIKLVLPTGVTLLSDSGGKGNFNTTTNEWTFSLNKNESTTKKFKVKFNYVGNFKLRVNNINYPSNGNIIRSVDVSEPTPEPTPSIQREDTITYIFYKTCAGESEQYFDIIINGYNENHIDDTYCCYLFSNVDGNITFVTPIKYNVTVLESDNCTLTTTGIDNRICFNIDTINEDFMAKIRVPINAINEGIANINIRDSKSSEFNDDLTILPVRKNIFISEYTPSRDKQYVQNSINIGVPNVWTIQAKSSIHNFFDEKKSDFIIDVEELIAYIGCIPIKRSHQAGEEASITNTKIDNTYLNRRYLGKEGDTRENIPMTLRMAWEDIASLQGLVALDKPIPIDTCPTIPDGDPVNHRGWAELTGITGIRKINSMVYECKPEVDYITHALLTKFGIETKDKLTNSTLDYFLSETHSYNDNLLERFSVDYMQFFNNVEDANNNFVGTYTLEPNSSISFNSKESINDYASYDIKFRNTLSELMSEEYDKNWEMAIRVLDKNDNNNILFEHYYNNFKHYDFNNQKVINTSDVTSKVLNGSSYNVINYDNMVLGYDSLAPLLETKKRVTHFNTLDNTVINNNNNTFELFLLDEENNGLPNKIVKVNLSNDDGYSEELEILTDNYGKFSFYINLGNGTYHLICKFDEDEENRNCIYETDFSVEYTRTDSSFIYYDDFTTFTNNSYYSTILVDNNGNGLSNKTVYYSFRDISNEKYGHEEPLITDSSGNVNIPIINNNGSKELKVIFKGDNSYNPCFFEDIVNINIQGNDSVIQSDDVVFMQGDSNKEYSITLTNKNNSPLKNKSVDIIFYNDKETYIQTTTTSSVGIAKTPIYLDRGIWNVDIKFNGDSTYKPCVKTNSILVTEYIQLGTYITSENTIGLDEDMIMNGLQDYYTIKLYDNNGNPVPNEPITIQVYNNNKTTQYVDTILKTDEYGVIPIPFVGVNETVVIESTYKGCTKYSSSYKSEKVNFVKTKNKSNVTIDAVTNSITIKEGDNPAEDVLYGYTEGQYRIIVTNFERGDTSIYEFNKDRVTNEGAVFLASLYKGTANVTIVYEGTDDYYPTMRTVQYTQSSSTRNISMYINNQSSDSENSYEWSIENPKSSYNVGELVRIKCKWKYKLPPIWVNVGIGYTGGGNPEGITDLNTNSNYVLTCSPKIYYSDLGTEMSYIEFDTIVPSNGNIAVVIPTNPNTTTQTAIYTISNLVSNVLTNDTSLSITRFGYLHETYQNIRINSTSANAVSGERINDYVLIKCINTDTLEELYYSTYLTGKNVITNLKYTLNKGNWKINAVTHQYNNYKGAIYTNSATIDTTTYFDNTAIDKIFEYGYYTDKGDVSIQNCLDNVNDTIISTSNENLLRSIMNSNYTNSTNYVLSFDWEYQFNPDYGYLYLIVNGNSQNNDGIYIAPHRVEVYENGQNTYNQSFGNVPVTQTVKIIIERMGKKYKIQFGNQLYYFDVGAKYNRLGLAIQGQGIYSKFSNFSFIDGKTNDIITPDINEVDLNTTIFGSDLHLEFKKNNLSVVDYGMVADGDVKGANILLNDVVLPDSDYELEIEVIYNNTRFERLNNLEGLLQVRIFEDISHNNQAMKYSNILCSPVPIPNSITRFTRLCDEGTMYYVEVPNNKIAKYLCNPYIQYKGGTDLKTETGISIFNLDNGYSPVMLSNGLVRAEFHRYTGYIVVSRYDEETGDWYKCNIFKLKNEPQLYLDENYSDDKAIVRFGDTKWTIWRGRPFIRLENPNDNLRILNLVDRVFCETVGNEFNMGFVEEYDTSMGIFNPQMSVQQLKQELHIGQNIKTDNFDLYDYDSNYYIGEESNTGELDIVSLNNDNALMVDTNNVNTALVFPTNGNYIKKPSKDFSILIGDGNYNFSDDIMIKARGFDDNGAIHTTEGIQYGLWEQLKSIGTGYQNYNITSNDLYISYVSGTSTKTGTISENNGVITINNNDYNTLSTVTIDINHINTYDYSFTYPTVVEFDLLDFSNPDGVPTNTRLQFYDGTNNSTYSLKNGGRGHVKAIVYEDKQEFYVDGVLKATNNMTVDMFRIALQTHTFIKLSNLKVMTVNGRYIDDDKLFISQDNETNTASITTYTVNDNEEYLIRHNDNLPNVVGTVSILETTTNFAYNAPTMIEFDVVSYTNPNGASVGTRVQLYDKTNNATCTIPTLLGEATSGHIKVIADYNKQEFYCDGVLKKTTNLPLSNFRISWQTFGQIRIKNIRIGEGTPNEGLRVVFTNCPEEVKFIDFVLYLKGSTNEIVLKDFMVYEGINEMGYDVDTSRINANNTSIVFNNSSYACLYNEDDPCGLAIVRPNKEEFTLKELTASNETLIIPYMKKYTDYDDVSNVILEYFNSLDQKINVDWEG